LTFWTSLFSLLHLFWIHLFSIIMFTGLVERVGTVVSVVEQDQSESGGNGWTITVGDAADILVDCHIGDSIAINGKVQQRGRWTDRFPRILLLITFTLRHLSDCYRVRSRILQSGCGSWKPAKNEPR
jgi:hypothetical protein